MDQQTMNDRIQTWQERLNDASGKWGGVEICAVTKTVDVETINLAYTAGIRTIGENRVQELTEKWDSLHQDFKVHLIGRLQTNKVKYIAEKIDMIQSLDRDALAWEVNRQALKNERVMEALVQVNVAGEIQKGGIPEDELIPFLGRVSAMEGIRVRGLMAIMPRADDPEEIRPYFRKMRRWFDRLQEHPMPGIKIDILSMGMSHDCLVAAE